LYAYIYAYLYIYIYTRSLPQRKSRGKSKRRGRGREGACKSANTASFIGIKSTSIETAAARREESLQHLQHGEREKRAPDGAPRVSMSLSTALLHILARSLIWNLNSALIAL
jgi:hypothetical protein